MVDLDKEREAFQNWAWESVENANLDNKYRSIVDMQFIAWKARAESTQAEIDSLKAENTALKEKLGNASQGVVLNCSQLVECLEFAAPDLKIEQTEYSNQQMSNEVSIDYFEDGNSGSGFYAHILECPEEGSIKLSDEAAQGDGDE